MQLAQTFCPPGNPCITGPLPAGKFPDVASIVSLALTLLFPIAGLILFVNIVWGGFQYLASQGEEKALTAARGRITTSLIGFILLVASYWITQLACTVLHTSGPFC